MTPDRLAALQAAFGTVSHQTATSGHVAVRNVTHLRQLADHTRGWATLERITRGGFPALIRVTETPSPNAQPDEEKATNYVHTQVFKDGQAIGAAVTGFLLPSKVSPFVTALSQVLTEAPEGWADRVIIRVE